jgi:hypothetical protein
LPDLRRCELLIESLERCSSDATHYLIVDRRDQRAFAHLQRGKTQIIESEEILGNWIFRSPGRKGYWLSAKALPVRGWIIQQILKIGIVDFIRERTLVFCDSDTAFFRSFERDALLINGKVGLLDVDSTADTRRWTTTARHLLGLDDHGAEFRNHIGNMICWNRETIGALRQRIESRTGLKWQVALARTLSFSEYMLYGVFVREALGYNAVDHAPSSVPLVKPSWNVSLTTDSALAGFFSSFDPRTVAVMIHSKDGIDPARYRPYLERLWTQNNSEAAH